MHSSPGFGIPLPRSPGQPLSAPAESTEWTHCGGWLSQSAQLPDQSTRLSGLNSRSTFSCSSPGWKHRSKALASSEASRLAGRRPLTPVFTWSSLDGAICVLIPSA